MSLSFSFRIMPAAHPAAWPKTEQVDMIEWQHALRGWRRSAARSREGFPIHSARDSGKEWSTIYQRECGEWPLYEILEGRECQWGNFRVRCGLGIFHRSFLEWIIFHRRGLYQPKNKTRLVKMSVITQVKINFHLLHYYKRGTIRETPSFIFKF